MPVRSCAHYHH